MVIFNLKVYLSLKVFNHITLHNYFELDNNELDNKNISKYINDE